MPALYLYDDDRARAFEPFALTRPLGEMRAGAALIRDRWERALGATAAGAIVAPHLADFSETGAPTAAGGIIPAGSVVANTRCVVPLGWSDRECDVWTCQGVVAALRLGQDVAVEELVDGAQPLDAFGATGTRVAEIPGRWLAEVWSFIVDLLPQLRDDAMAVGPQLACETPAAAHVVGDFPVFIERGATVEPMVLLDASAGPIVVRSGAIVKAFTRLAGPCYVGDGATILGGQVSGCSIGEVTLVRGEISESVVLGHANKAHDGFVGHSYLGRWVNLGAGTTTSNLKNTYGNVALWTPGGLRDTGTIKMGTLFGDHVKTGIGLRLTTGTVVGAGSSVHGSMPPKFVPPFSWGDGQSLDEYDAERFVRTAARAMSRRHVELTEPARRQLAAAHERTRALRESAVAEIGA